MSTISFTDLDPADEGRREALCTLGNGYFATRGAAPEARADEVHYPGTYVAGCYDRATSTVDGHDVEQESLVNMPNWLPVTFCIDDGPWFNLDRVEILVHELDLDFERGILVRRTRFRDVIGRTMRMVQRRFVHMRYPHLAGLQTSLTAEDWSGTITVRAGIDGNVTNNGVARYRALRGDHLTDHATQEIIPGHVLLHARTQQSHVRIAEASRCRAWLNNSPTEPRRQLVHTDTWIGHDYTLEITEGETLQLDKICSLHTSRDLASTEPAVEAIHSVREADDFDALLPPHAMAWSHLWNRFHCGLSTSTAAQQAVHLHTFHLLQTVSPNTIDCDAGVPARGWHGEAYRGHVFWDELFVLPTMNLRMPHLSRDLLRYRYHRLPQARLAAHREGLSGAMFPWQSGSNGREESQKWHLNPRSGRWLPDHTHRQRHIGLAIAHNIWHHYRSTGDSEFLDDYGAEMFLEITRFFASLADYDHTSDRYSIRGVVGPDEYHTHYPGTDRPGIDNNAYTNVLTAWLCRTAVQLLEEITPERHAELTAMLKLTKVEFHHWIHLSQRIFVPFHSDGIISQFEGYDTLVELDWDHYTHQYGNIRRLDRILEAENDDPNRYKAAKQADVLMLFYLFSAEELRGILEGLGYQLPPEQIPRTVNYYLDRTCHGSTLSAVVHAWVLARGRRHRAVEFFDEALGSDLHDIQTGTTAEGIHLAAMAGTLDLLQRCFAGLEIRDEVLRLNPSWPAELGTLELSLHYQGQPVSITITERTARIRTTPGHFPPITCVCGPHIARLGPGDSATMSLE